MGKADDSRRTKKRTQKNGIRNPQKNRVRNLAKATNENSISIKASNDASKKTSNVKEMMTPYQKRQSKHRFCLFYYDFVWFSMDFGEKQAKREQFYCVKTG